MKRPGCILAAIGLVLAGCGGSSKTGATATRSTQTVTARAPATTQPTTTQPTTTAPSSREVAPGIVSASVGAITATMHASTHHPHVNQNWPVSFTATSAGKPAKAKVHYQYLFAGQVVARRSHYTFTGSFHDIFMWPSSAVGYPLTFRAVISSQGVTLNLDYPVRVMR